MTLKVFVITSRQGMHKGERSRIFTAFYFQEPHPLEHGSVYSQWRCRELAAVLARETGVQLGRESVRGVLKKNTISSYRPTGRLHPTPADLASGSIDLAALEYRARQGDIILLYEDETILWRFARLCRKFSFEAIWGMLSPWDAE